MQIPWKMAGDQREERPILDSGRNRKNPRKPPRLPESKVLAMPTNQRDSRPRLITCAILAFAFGLVCQDAGGQSITAPGSIARRGSVIKAGPISQARTSLGHRDPSRLPNPIRQADHTEPLTDLPGTTPPSIYDSSTDYGDSVAESAWGTGYDLPINGLRGQPTHAHQVIRAPSNQPPGQQQASGKISKKHLVHPPYSSHRRRIQPAPATLPGGKQRESWKSPYSYGYFGASGTRHWSLHHGYRDRYTEWRLK